MKWNSGFNVTELLSAVSKSRTLQDTGSVSYGHFGVPDYWRSILETAIIDETVPESVKSAAIAKAMNSSQTLSISSFKAAYHEHKRKLQDRQKTWLVVYPLWGQIKLLQNRYKSEDVSIDFNPSENTKVFTEVIHNRAEQRKSFKSGFENTFEEIANYKLCFARTKASDPETAQNTTQKALDEVLGCTNFWSSHGSNWRMYSGIQRPISRILVAPHITIHGLKGSLAYPGFYYHQWYPKNYFNAEPNEQKHRSIKKATKLTFEKIHELPDKWRPNALKALRLYNQAFSQHNPQDAFMLGWQVLETIAGFKNSNHDRIIRRAAGFFTTRSEMTALGQHLKLRRNMYSHSGEVSTQFGDTLAHQIKSLIEPMMRHYLANPFKFSSEEEFWQFCDVSSEENSRERTLYILNCADKFHSPTENTGG
ncbi:MAG: hypothetical protein AAFX90_16980 [Pseudomonadota bacterium]